jgi:hydroxymethylbilane synthase
VRVRIGTRGSDLALWQARHVTALLAECGVSAEIVVLKTRGDLIDDVPLQQLEGKAFFTAEIERALLKNEVDLAVHSHKDLPTEDTPGLVIAAVPARGPQGERLLVSRGAHDPDAPFLPLSRGARVGTSAPRRNEQLRTLRPDLEVLDLRGNVPTRVKRLQEGRYDAIVLACAGLERLKLDIGDLAAFDLPEDLVTPAPAQGALALQVRAGDTALLRLCRERLHHDATAQAIAAERSLLVTSGGGCSLPLAAAVRAATGVETASVEGAGADRGRPQSPPPQAGGLGQGRESSALSTQELGEAVAPASRTATAASIAAPLAVAAATQVTTHRTTSAATPSAAPTPPATAATFVAHSFLGAGHPAALQPAARFARWSVGYGATPAAAIAAARAKLDTGAATGFGPFGGLSVALAGAAADGSVLGERLESLGATVTLERLIELAPIAGVDLATPLAALRPGDVLAVTSRQAARLLAGHPVPRGVEIAAVGRACARALAEIGLVASVVGDGGGEALAARLAPPANARVLWPCAEDALPDFAAALEARKIELRKLAIYRTTRVTAPQLAAEVDVRVYMSPSAVEAALEWERAHPTNTTRRFALGHATANALENARLAATAPSCDAGPITEALVAALWRHVRSMETVR